MIYLKEFSNHKDYSDIMNNVEIQIEVPSVSYCDDADDVHFNTYKLIKFYVGEITPPQTVKIYTDSSTSVNVTVSEGNKWYTYILPQNKGLSKIESGTYDTDTKEWSNGIVKKVIVKANINHSYDEGNIIPYSTIEAFFKGSNTSNVTNMYEMFDDCYSLTSLDLSNFDTSNVTDMGNMFRGCSGLTSLDVGSFDTSNVTNMGYMFYGCRSLTSLDVGSFNTSNVTRMSSMFYDCSGLTSLDVSNFDTSKVVYMDGMFYGCSNLTSLDLSKWDTSNVTDMHNMFRGCSSLKTIRMVGCKQPTIDKIKAQLTTDGIINNVTIVTE